MNGLLNYVTIWLFFFLYLSCSENFKGKLPERGWQSNLLQIDSTKIERGLLFRNEKSVILSNKKMISISKQDTKYTIMALGYCQVSDSAIYILERFVPEIHIFRMNGSFEKTINLQINNTDFTHEFTELIILRKNKYLVKDARKSIIYLFDSDGQMIKVYASKDKFNFFAPHNMDYVDRGNALEIYTSIWQYLQGDPKKVRLNDCHTIGKLFGENTSIKTFANYDSLYEKYNLLCFQPAYLRIWKNRIYQVQQALPFIRIYSLDGEFLSTFGVPGYHMRPIQKQPKFQNDMKILEYINSHTLYGNLFILDGCSGYNKPILIVSYQNPDRKNPYRYFCILYSPEGLVLYNDLSVPAMPIQVDSDRSAIFFLEATEDSITIIEKCISIE